MTASSAQTSPAAPPQARTQAGALRRVGVEIEFDGLDCAETGGLLRRLFGGRIVWHDPYRLELLDSALGRFLVELDMSLAHPEKPDERRRRDEWDDFIAELEADLAETVGDLGSLWMPVEIVAPPIAWSELGALDRLVESLRQSGAGGTRSGLLSAYGTQLNPEIASSETGELLATLRAFLLLSDWLREEIGVDLRRRFTPFIDPFPNAYRELVLDPAYAPDRHRLIDDYLAHNPTRNRELDLLPLFAFLEPERVRARLPREKIHARPTFHYRLPDTRLDLPDWSVGLEWERWVTVERLAADPDRLGRGMELFRRHRAQLIPHGWPAQSRALAEAVADGSVARSGPPGSAARR